MIEIICCLLILLFLYTSVSKFIDFTRFRGDINNQPFPNWMTPFLLWVIPLLEITISLLLMVSSTRKTGLYLSFGLMSLFTIYTALVLFNFFDRVPCSCGGVIRQLSWNEHLLFNLFFSGMSLLGIYLSRKSGSPNKSGAYYNQLKTTNAATYAKD